MGEDSTSHTRYLQSLPSLCASDSRCGAWEGRQASVSKCLNIMCKHCPLCSGFPKKEPCPDIQAEFRASCGNFWSGVSTVCLSFLCTWLIPGSSVLRVWHTVGRRWAAVKYTGRPVGERRGGWQVPGLTLSLYTDDRAALDDVQSLLFCKYFYILF